MLECALSLFVVQLGFLRTCPMHITALPLQRFNKSTATACACACAWAAGGAGGFVAAAGLKCMGQVQAWRAPEQAKERFGATVLSEAEASQGPSGPGLSGRRPGQLASWRRDDISQIVGSSALNHCGTAAAVLLGCLEDVCRFAAILAGMTTASSAHLHHGTRTRVLRGCHPALASSLSAYQPASQPASQPATTS